jgi:curved DNA-binding protein CbpA
MTDTQPNRPAPAASGTLAKTPILHLLIYALEKRLSGTIELSYAADGRSAAVLFVGGQPAKVRTSEPLAYLGNVLLDLGYLTQSQLDSSLEELMLAKRQAPKLHGQLLLAQGIINPAKLQSALHEQLVRRLRFVADMPGETVYAYYEGFDALRGWGRDDPSGVDPMPLLWGILRESPPWDHINGALARSASSPLRLAPAADLQRLGLAAAESKAAEVLRERAVVMADFAKVAKLDEPTAQLLTYLLLITKQVDVLAPAETSNASPRSVAAAASIANASSLADAGASAPPAGRGSPSLPSTPPEENDSEGSVTLPPPPDLAPELAERWREIVARAASVDRSDYFMMLDVTREATREVIESAFFTLAKRWHPDRLPGALAPVRRACARVFARMSEARAVLVDDKKRARYLKLAAEGSGSPEMQEAVAKVLDASSYFQKAEVCFRRGDLGQAESLCRKAVDLDATQPDYMALLAWVVALKPESQTPGKAAECIDQLSAAIKMNDRCEKAYFWRGMLLKRIGKEAQALKDFGRAAELNPRNIDAAREVRLHKMRGGRSTAPARTDGGAQSPRKTSAPQKPGQRPQKGGLFGRLFKKP